MQIIIMGTECEAARLIIQHFLSGGHEAILVTSDEELEKAKQQLQLASQVKLDDLVISYPKEPIQLAIASTMKPTVERKGVIPPGYRAKHQRRGR
jgi:hypothetical protein